MHFGLYDRDSQALAKESLPRDQEIYQNLEIIHKEIMHFQPSVSGDLKLLQANTYCSQHAMFTMCILFTTLTTKHRIHVCVKGHQNNLQTSKIIPCRDHDSNFEIPGSATVLDLKATDFDHVNSKMPNSHRLRNSVSMGIWVGVVSLVPPPPCIVDMCKK